MTLDLLLRSLRERIAPFADRLAKGLAALSGLMTGESGRRLAVVRSTRNGAARLVRDFRRRGRGGWRAN